MLPLSQRLAFDYETQTLWQSSPKSITDLHVRLCAQRSREQLTCKFAYLDFRSAGTVVTANTYAFSVSPSRPLGKVDRFSSIVMVVDPRRVLLDCSVTPASRDVLSPFACGVSKCVVFEMV
jgi:hypothetical protein